MTSSSRLSPQYEMQLRNFVARNPAYADLAKQITPSPVHADALAAAPPDDTQAPIQFRMDVLGHVLVATTTDQPPASIAAAADMFQECSVLLAAVTVALGKKGKTLFDYAAVRPILMGCGDFVSMGISDRSFHSDDKSLTLDMAVIADVMASFIGIETTAALGTITNIAKTVVSNVGQQLTFSKSDTDSTKKIGHLMFVCQNLMGAPMVSLSYFYSSYAESMSKITTPCATTSATTIDFTFHQEDYMFVSPAAIKKYSPGFAEDQAEFDKLIDKLASLIPK